MKPRRITTGRYADTAWTQFGVLIGQAMEKGPPTSMVEPLYVVDAALQFFLQLAADNDSPNFRTNAVKLCSEVLAGGEDAPTLDDLMALLVRGANQTDAVLAARDTAVTLTQRGEALKKHQLAKQNAISSTQFVAIMAGFVEIVKKHAPDKAEAIVLDCRARAIVAEKAREPVLIGS